MSCAWPSAFALSTPALSHFATIGSAAAVVAGSSSSFCRACVVVGVQGNRAPFHPGDGSDDARLQRHRGGSGPGGRNQQPPGMIGQRSRHDGHHEVGQRLRTVVRQRLGHVGRGLLGCRGNQRRPRPVVGGRREGVEHSLALRGRRRGARLLVELERLAPHRAS